MSFSTPKIKIFRTSIKTPKISIPKLNFVSKGIVGGKTPKGGKNMKVKINLK